MGRVESLFLFQVYRHEEFLLSFGTFDSLNSQKSEPTLGYTVSSSVGSVVLFVAKVVQYRLSCVVLLQSVPLIDHIFYIELGSLNPCLTHPK